MARFIISAFADEASASLNGQVAALKRNGIDCIEPRSIDGRGILELTENELHEAAKRLAREGIGVSALGSPIGKFPIEEDFAPQRELFFKALRACEILGTRRMRIFSFYVPSAERERWSGEVAARLSFMLDEAEKRGITLCHENEAKIYGESPSAVRDLFARLPRLGGVFDPANYVLCDADPEEGLKATLSRFKYMHVKDAVMAEKAMVPAGEGDGRIAEALDAVDKMTEATVHLTLEPHLHVFDGYGLIDERELRGRYSYKTGDDAFDAAARALKALLEKCGFKKGEDNAWTR